MVSTYLKNYRKEKRRQYFSRQRQIQRELDLYGKDILHSANFGKNAEYMQHGTISVKEHSINVARYSVALSEKLHVPHNREDLVRGALLHDYFLYDWHKVDTVRPHRLHGFYHPERALANAENEYQLTERQRDIIEKHMWPLTIRHIPMCREAWMVTAADKYCSFMETVHLQKGHRKKRTVSGKKQVRETGQNEESL